MVKRETNLKKTAAVMKYWMAMLVILSALALSGIASAAEKSTYLSPWPDGETLTSRYGDPKDLLAGAGDSGHQREGSLPATTRKIRGKQ